MVGANRILWITPAYLAENTVIDDNVSTNILQVNIRVAEDKFLHPLIGSQMTSKVNQLINDKIVSGVTIPAIYKTLIDDYIIPCLMEYAVYENIPFTFKFRNKGISLQNSPDSTSAGLDELNYLSQKVLTTAQFYGERLITFLQVGYTGNVSFPEYTLVEAGDLHPARGDYFNGIHIPGANRNSNSNFGLGIGIDINI